MALILTATGVTDGNGRPLLNGSGTPLQFIQSAYTSVYENSSSQSEYDLPGALGDGSFGITPTSSSSTLLFQFVLAQGQEDTWRHQSYRFYYKIGSGGSWVNFYGTTGYVWIVSNSGSLNSHRAQTLINPATTTTVYFKVTANNHGNGNTLHLNQNNSNASTANNNEGQVSSSVNVWEFSG
jgi:hypothetical protein